MVIPADNTEEQLALQLIEKTGVNLFLTRWRQEEAARQGKPPYAIMPQKALLGVVRLCPTDERSLLSLPGIGKVTARKYGMELLRIITEFQPDKNRTPGLFPAE